MINRTSLQQLKEWIYFDYQDNLSTYNLDVTNPDNIALYYYDADNANKLSILDSSKYSVDIDHSRIKLLDSTIPTPCHMLVVYTLSKHLTNILYDFTFPDFSFLQNLSVPTYTSDWLSGEQLVPLYQGNAINTLTLYPSDLVAISQNNALLTGVHGEPYAVISISPRYSDFFSWYNSNLTDANTLKTYYYNIITGLNTFITNNTISGLPKPPLGDPNALSLALIGSNYNNVLETDVRPLYQYQVDYYDTLNSNTTAKYSTLQNNINRMYYYNPSFTDNTSLDLIIKRDGYTPTFDSLTGKYSFGTNKEGVNYDRPGSAFVLAELSYAKWKYWFDNGGATNFLYYNLVKNSPTDLAFKQIISLNINNNALSSPPLAFSAFDLYLVAVSPTGAWAGQANKYAYNDGSGWFFLNPQNNDTIVVTNGVNAGSYYQYNGSSWNSISSISGDASNIGKGTEFENYALLAAEYYQPYTASLNTIFNDYQAYVSSTLPISLAQATNDLQYGNSTSFTIVTNMVNDIVSTLTATTVPVWDEYKTTLQLPYTLSFDYKSLVSLNPYYFKDDINKIFLLDNTGLFFGDYYDIATYPDVYLVGASQEKYSDFINLPEYNGFKLYLANLQNYMTTIATTINLYLSEIQQYCMAQDIQFDMQYYFDRFIYKQYDVVNTIASLKATVGDDSLTKNPNNITAKQINDSLSENIASIHKDFLLSLKIHPLFEKQIDLTLPSPPDDFVLDHYTIILRFDVTRDKWVLDYGISIDNTSNIDTNNQLAAICSLTTIEQLRAFFDVPTKDYIMNNFQYFYPGSIHAFASPPSSNWFLCDNSVVDKRSFPNAYANFINKITVQATQNSNQYLVISMSKNYAMNSGIVVYSSDNLFSFGKISNYNPNTKILTLTKPSNTSGRFVLDHIDYFGAKLSDINSSQFSLPNLQQRITVGCDLNNEKIGYVINDNDKWLTADQMPQIPIQYQGDLIGRDQLFATLAASFISLPYINVNQEKITKVSQVGIDVRQKACAIGKFYMRMR